MREQKINRIVVWGLRKKYHTHRHIHQAFYENALKLGYDAIWVEDEKKNQKLIQPGDLIIAAEPVGKMVPEKFVLEDYHLPIRSDIFYCLHGYKKVFTEKLNRSNYLNLVVYRDHEFKKEDVEQWNPFTYFNKNTKTLYQPWGTNLLVHEFKKPVFNKNSFVFWVGSIWNDKDNHGNVKQIEELKNILQKNKLRFVHVKFIPDFINSFLIRTSRIAPAIAGRSQVQENYLPCRVFKNISYGQLGITNVKKFEEIFGDAFVKGDTIRELVNNALSLDEKKYKEMVIKQQEAVKKYTYKEALENIIKGMFY